MRINKTFYILLSLILCLLGISKHSLCQDQSSEQSRIVDFKADVMTPIKLSSDSTALKLTGNVMFYHNGAIITCDSAIRYSNKRMECYVNVLINQNDTYIYGNRADYNGDLNLARVYAPIVKVIDKEITMYTYNFVFNTLDKVGYYYGGATINQKDSQLESEKGYYYSDLREVVCVEDVQIKNPEYKVKSDSLGYNMDTEFARFYVPSVIWRTEGDILSADKGVIDNPSSTYHFYENSYVLTAEQELWADSIDYFSFNENVILKDNIQIRDTVNNTLAFGDYAKYWSKEQNILLTKNPSTISYEYENPDSLFMRADSIFLYTVSEDQARGIKSLSEQSQNENRIIEEELIIDEPELIPSDSLATDSLPFSEGLRELSEMEDAGIEQLDQLQVEQVLDTDGQVVLSKKEQKALVAAQKRKAKEEKRLAKIKARRIKLGLEASDQEKELLALEQAKADSLHLEYHTQRLDSLQNTANQILAADTIATDSISSDSLYRIVRAYRDVKIYRRDFQVVCDSLEGFSIDTTLHLYINPVMWNEQNQIKSNVVDIFSKEGNLDRAMFTGSPIMISKVDELHYNQVRGKELESFFRNNQIVRTEINANAQTLYYMTEEDDDGISSIVGFLVANCANITFLIEDRQVESIIYRGNPDYVIYPMDKIPMDQPQRFDNFSWEEYRRPVSKDDIFNRKILATQRDKFENLPLPTFPITANIDAQKAQLTADGIWVDRNDTVSEGAINFVRSLGYTIFDPRDEEIEMMTEEDNIE